MVMAPMPVRAQREPPAIGPALAIQAGWGVIVPSETDQIEWKVVFGAGFEYAFSHRFSLALHLQRFAIDNPAGRFGYTGLVLQPMLLTRGRDNPRLFTGVRIGHMWKSSRAAAVFQDPATAHAVSLGLVAGTRSYLAPTVAVEGALLGDLMRFGDVVADGLSVHGTSSSSVSLIFRVGLVLALQRPGGSRR
jgi:hypothetical protein